MLRLVHVTAYITMRGYLFSLVAQLSELILRLLLHPSSLQLDTIGVIHMLETDATNGACVFMHEASPGSGIPILPAHLRMR